MPTRRSDAALYRSLAAVAGLTIVAVTVLSFGVGPWLRALTDSIPNQHVRFAARMGSFLLLFWSIILVGLRIARRTGYLSVGRYPYLYPQIGSKHCSGNAEHPAPPEAQEDARG